MMILGVLTDLQTDFLNKHQLQTIFGELILVEQVETVNLSQMTTLGSLKVDKLLHS